MFIPMNREKWMGEFSVCHHLTVGRFLQGKSGATLPIYYVLRAWDYSIPAYTHYRRPLASTSCIWSSGVFTRGLFRSE